MADLCAHCGAVAVGATSADGQRFCCAGCRAAHALILGAGLADYYRLAPTPGATPALVAAEAWDDLVRRRSDGMGEITWHVSGMHCAACVWILERLPALQRGVLAATARFGDETLCVIFDPRETTPAAVARTIASLGYAPRAPSGREEAKRAERRDLLQRLAVSAASAMAAMHLSLNLYAGDLTRDLDPSTRLGFGAASGLVAIPAIAYGAAPFLRGAWGGLRARRFGVDAATALVVLIGTFASVVGVVTGGDLYFDAVAMYVAILLAGRLALLAAKERVLRASGLQAELLPRHARRIEDDTERQIPTNSLQPGDRVVITAGEALPCDGPAESPAALDTSLLTGESRSAAVGAGAEVFAGTICLSPRLVVIASAVGAQTRLGRLLADIGRPRGDGSSWEDRWLARATPLVVLAALGILAWWWPRDAHLAMRQAVAAIMVCCPCALGLAVPLAQAVAIARAARRGILLRDPCVLERLRTVRHAVFDKTGTLTEGRMRVTSWTWLTPDRDTRGDILAAVAAAEGRARHPAAAAIYERAGTPGTISAWREEPGRGVSCLAPIGGHERELRVGSPAFTGGDADVEAVSTAQISVDGVPVARIALADPLRADARAMAEAARVQGWSLHLLSGDASTVARAVAAEVGITDVEGALLPEDKAARIEALGDAAVIGDGANDAPAMRLAAAAIGVRGGLAASLDCCDAVLVGMAEQDRGDALRELFAASGAVRRTGTTLLAFSIIYNLTGLILVASGLWGPWICAIAMPTSSLVAIAIAGSCRAFRSAPSPPEHL
jgi:Cu2+-exporting ATPase